VEYGLIVIPAGGARSVRRARTHDALAKADFMMRARGRAPVPCGAKADFMIETDRLRIRPC
jgi:hypothetical protein